ncbi:hypothetical protein [Parapedobacter sp. DT-150]|uniref:hypothetical protein n=1 Tax=Parapedobacter sp. DT-150 TaxID=3396162 RepID=UPI003F1E31E2
MRIAAASLPQSARSATRSNGAAHALLLTAAISPKADPAPTIFPYGYARPLPLCSRYAARRKPPYT